MLQSNRESPKKRVSCPSGVYKFGRCRVIKRRKPESLFRSRQNKAAMFACSDYDLGFLDRVDGASLLEGSCVLFNFCTILGLTGLVPEQRSKLNVVRRKDVDFFGRLDMSIEIGKRTTRRSWLPDDDRSPCNPVLRAS